jgi:AcrR family transcriptional regulator
MVPIAEEVYRLSDDAQRRDQPLMEEAALIRRRLPRNEREKLIVAEAISFFAEVGFEGQTRALAQRLGVTQPLLYRYFPDKEALIERVYAEVFVEGWQEGWGRILTDRTRPLRERLIDLYAAYAQANFSYERVRLFMFASLKDRTIANRYLAFVRDALFVPLCRELRVESGEDPAAPISELEIECAAGLHGAIGYVGMRRWIFDAQMPEEVSNVLGSLIDTFLSGAPAVFAGLVKQEKAAE